MLVSEFFVGDELPRCLVAKDDEMLQLQASYWDKRRNLPQEQRDAAETDCADWDESLAIKRERLKVRSTFPREFVAFDRCS